jgi:thiamine pyrophosphokinase
MNLIRVMPAEGRRNLFLKNPSSGLEEGFLMRAFIFANGDFKGSTNALKDFKDDDLIIAADGGAAHCLGIGLFPNVVIGDMDSIPPSEVEKLKSQNIRFITYAKYKDETDLELALKYAVNKGVDQIFFHGLLGGRLDQSLSNIFLLARDEWMNTDLIVFNGLDIAYLMRDGGNISLQGQPGDLVSLIPLSELVSGVSTDGLRWKLSESSLTLGTTLSISNEMLSFSARVKIGSGRLLLIHRKIQLIESED